MSIDPVTFLQNGNPAQFNRYSYTWNDPINGFDPDGRETRLMVEAKHLDMAVANGRMSQQERQAINVQQAKGAAAGLMLLAPDPSDLVVAGVLVKSAGALKTANTGRKTYQTYTKTNKKTGEVYSGRTSGTGSPADNVANRDKNHHMDGDDWGEAVLDKSSSNPDAIRGREQQLIDAHGGAKSQGGTSGNAINGIADSNKKRDQYLDAANKEF